MKKNQLSKSGPANGAAWLWFLRIVLLVFVFLRFFFDGITYPAFNHFWNITFFGLTAVVLLKDRLRTTYTREELVLFLFFIAAGVSMLLAPVVHSGIETVAQFLGYFCFLFLFIRAFSSRENGLLMRVILAAAFLVTVYGFYQYFWGFEETRRWVLTQPPEMVRNLPPTFLERMQSNRIFSTFVYPNVFACFLLMVFPLCFFFAGENMSRRIPAILFCLTTPAVLFMTGSTGGLYIFVLIVQIMVLFVMLGPARFRYGVTGVLLVEIIFLVVMYQTELLPKWTTLQDRGRYWQAAVKVTAARPVFGIGPENFRYAYLEFKVPGSMEAKHAHSIAFETLAEQGAVGLVLLVGFFGLCYRRLRRTPATAMTAGIAFSLTAGLLHNLLDFDFVDPSVGTVLFLLVGWAIIQSKDGQCDALLGTNHIGLISPESEAAGSRRGGVRDSTPHNADDLSRGFPRDAANAAIRMKATRCALTKMLSCLIITSVIAVGFPYLRYISATRIWDQARQAMSGSERTALMEEAERIYPTGEFSCQKGDLLTSGYIATREERFFHEAEAAYRTAIRLNPLASAYYRKLALLYWRRGDLPAAAEMYRRVLERYPTKKQYNVEAAVLHEKMGDAGTSRYYVERAGSLSSVSIEENDAIEALERNKLPWTESPK